MTRQFGLALGIAILIAVLGTPQRAQVLPAFRSGWEVTVGLAFASAIAALAIGRIRIAPAQIDIATALKQAVGVADGFSYKAPEPNAPVGRPHEGADRGRSL